MSTRPLTVADEGRYEIYCHHSAPTFYPEETHRTVQICIPFERALYGLVRQSETGKKLVHNFGARDILVLPIGQPHSVDWRRPADIASLHFAPEFIAEALDIGTLHMPDTFSLRDPFITAAANQLRQCLRGGNPPTPAFAEAIATLIAYRIGLKTGAQTLRATTRGVQSFSASDRKRLEAFVEGSLDRPLGISDLAKLMNLSLWHFMRRFQASYGTSPHAFILERRHIRAQNLLVESRYSVTEIAIEIGMSHSHFSRSFLQRFGVSPLEYRRQRRL